MLLPPLLLLLCAAILSAVVAATAALLLPAIVYRMTKFGCCWFIESDPSVLFLSFKRDLFFMYLLMVLSHLWPRFPYISVITAMRGPKAGVSPPRPSPPCTIYVYIPREAPPRRANALLGSAHARNSEDV